MFQEGHEACTYVQIEEQSGTTYECYSIYAALLKTSTSSTFALIPRILLRPRCTQYPPRKWLF